MKAGQGLIVTENTLNIIFIYTLFIQKCQEYRPIDMYGLGTKN